MPHRQYPKQQLKSAKNQSMQVHYLLYQENVCLKPAEVYKGQEGRKAKEAKLHHDLNRFRLISSDTNMQSCELYY